MIENPNRRHETKRGPFENAKLHKKLRDATDSRERGQSEKDAAAFHQHVFRKVDSDVLRSIKERHGRYIPKQRMQEARHLPASVLPRQEYQSLVRSAYDVDDNQAQRMLGHYDKQNGGIWVSQTHPLTARLLAHEHLHQLEDPKTGDMLGKGLEEGMTEWLARDAVGDPHFANQPRVYPHEVRIVNTLRALAGDRALKQAYFQGDWQALQQGVNEQLGEGALAKIARLTDQKKYKEAELFIRQNYENG